MSRRAVYLLIEERLTTASIPMRAIATVSSMKLNPPSDLNLFMVQEAPLVPLTLPSPSRERGIGLGPLGPTPIPPAAPITLQNTGATLTTLKCHCTSTQYPAIDARQAAASAHCDPGTPRAAFPARAAAIDTHQNAATPRIPIEIAMSSVSLCALSTFGGVNIISPKSRVRSASHPCGNTSASDSGPYPRTGRFASNCSVWRQK